MSARPGDWGLLDRDGDPVPGDPEMVAKEITYYDRVADDIKHQVARLRRLADPDEALKGEYAESLQKSCEELADHMDRAHGRFETVAEQLARLKPALVTAMDDTRSALRAAENAQDAADSANPEGFSLIEMLDEDNKDAHAAGEKLADARDGLDRAKQACDEAVDAFDRVARKVADEIRDACDDRMKDGRFEGIKSWVKDHVELLKNISKWLGRIVLVLAVVILLLSNPAGWLIGLAALGAVGLLAVDSLLAASGEGSWGDVALDVVGVLTLGTGAIAGKLVKFGRSLTLFKAGRTAGVSKMGESLRAAFNGRGLTGFVRNVYRGFKPSTWGTAMREGRDAYKTARAFPLLDAPLRSVLSFPFSREIAGQVDDLARIAQTYGPGTISGLHQGAVSLARTNAGVEAVVSTIDNALDEGGNFHVPVLGDIDAGLDKLTTREIGSLW